MLIRSTDLTDTEDNTSTSGRKNLGNSDRTGGAETARYRMNFPPNGMIRSIINLNDNHMEVGINSGF